MFEAFAEAVLDLIQICALSTIVATIFLGVAWIAKAKLGD